MNVKHRKKDDGDDSQCLIRRGQPGCDEFHGKEVSKKTKVGRKGAK